MIRVISVDDHAVVRRGVRQLLSDTVDIALAGEAKDAGEMLRLLQSEPCDVLLLDITMQGKDGLSLLREIKDRWPRIAVIMLTMHPADQYAIRALRAGASGYVGKDSMPEELINAIRKVATGVRHVPPAMVELLAAQFEAGEEKPPHEMLSDREFAVLCRIGAGKSVSQIAEELFLSTNTVSTYRTRILSKLKLTHTVELMHYAVSHGLKG